MIISLQLSNSVCPNKVVMYMFEKNANIVNRIKSIKKLTFLRGILLRRLRPGRLFRVFGFSFVD